MTASIPGSGTTAVPAIASVGPAIRLVPVATNAPPWVSNALSISE